MFVPGGVSGVALKLTSPNMHACSDRFGFVLEAHNRFIVMLICVSSLSHSESGKFESIPANSVLRCT